jgi:hypothetical protein
MKLGLMTSWLNDGSGLNRAEFSDQFNSGKNYYFMAYPSKPTILWHAVRRTLYRAFGMNIP